jgi:hypothetical protein
VVVELRQDLTPHGQHVFNITANGQPTTAEVWLGYGDSEQHVQAATGEIPRFASLRYATFHLPATDARELKVWAHQITPEENSQGLPALLNVHCGNEKKEFDLKSCGGQVILPINGEACRLEITLPDLS